MIYYFMYKMERYLTIEQIEFVKKNGFNDKGLRYTIEELQRVVPKTLSMEELAKYVDAITFAKIEYKEDDFFRPQLVMIEPGRTVPVTATGLGNLAYLALNASNDDVRAKASEIYNVIIQSL